MAGKTCPGRQESEPADILSVQSLLTTYMLLKVQDGGLECRTQVQPAQPKKIVNPIGTSG